MILILFAAATLAALCEARRGAYSSDTEWRRELHISLVLGGAAAVISAALPGRDMMMTAEDSVAVGLAVFIADDLLYYVSHRLSHRINVFWASHAVHHSPVRFDYLTGLRQPPTWLLTPAAAAPLILLAAGAPAATLVLSGSVRALYHFAIHTERVRRLPGLMEFVFNSPSHHRVHHSVEEGCLDRNFGGVLIIWDRLFGTFAPEGAGGTRRYGLVHPMRGGAWDVLATPWRRLITSIGAAPTLPTRFAMLVAPPSKLCRLA